MYSNLAISLSQKLNQTEILRLAGCVAGNVGNREHLLSAALATDRRTSINALWAMTHLPRSESGWLQSLQNVFIDTLLQETDTGKQRLLLQLLREQEYDPENIRADFLDFCLSKINSECEPCAVRCFCIYTAFRMCRHYPELILELKQHLDMMQMQVLSPGLRSALHQTMARISALGNGDETLR